MDEKQQIEAADDVQDVLASLMAVEPSPEFAARVRQRIAADADALEWRSVHLALPVLAAAAVVAFGVLLIFTVDRRVAPAHQMPASATRTVEPAASDLSTPVLEPAVVAVSRQEEEPPALVPRGEIVAVQRLLSAARAGRFEFQLVPAALPVADELSAPEPISVPPIELMPIGASSAFE
jgi:hypothetical protein